MGGGTQAAGSIPELRAQGRLQMRCGGSFFPSLALESGETRAEVGIISLLGALCVQSAL